MNRACYRKLHRYKYQLMQDYEIETGLGGYSIETDYIALPPSGRMTIRQAYAWDGPSGPTIDTLTLMRGSLVHDALYQLLRLEALPSKEKAFADKLLRTICLEDGMNHLFARIVYLGVKWFGGSSSRPGTERPDMIICVPVDN
ncbi:MAG: hypothetical protein C0623_12785 [Desulfuromonas sp.]|nr:MAG: hypothetical protein C0623_12785 [Desulfuromonas sp.]